MILTAPREKINVKITSVRLRPIQFEIGALPRAPKKAPAWRTDTTLDDTLFVLFVFAEPSGFNMPKCVWKYGCDTTPPAIPLRNQSDFLSCIQYVTHVSYPNSTIPQYATTARSVK